MDISTPWWIRRCFNFQARKTSRRVIRWPTLSLPQPNGPGITLRVDDSGPLPLTPRDNIYMFMLTNRVSRRVNIFAATAAQSAAVGIVDVFIDRYIMLSESAL